MCVYLKSQVNLSILSKYALNILTTPFLITWFFIITILLQKIQSQPFFHFNKYQISLL